MHEEFYQIPDKTIKLIEETKKKGKKVIAVGTTVVRTLETYAITGKKEGFLATCLYTLLLSFRLLMHLLTKLSSFQKSKPYYSFVSSLLPGKRTFIPLCITTLQ